MDNSTAGLQWSWDVLRKSQISFRYLLDILSYLWDASIELGVLQESIRIYTSVSNIVSLPTICPPADDFCSASRSRRSLRSHRRHLWIQGNPRDTNSPVQLQFSPQKNGSQIPQLRLPVRHGTTVVRSPTRKWRARTRRVGTSPKKSSSMLSVQHIHVLNGWGLSLKRLLPASQTFWSIPTRLLASGPERSSN